MPSFGRIGRQSNRSQHNLVEQQSAPPPLSALSTSTSSSGAGVGPGSGGGAPGSANTPPSASSTGISSTDSFQVDTRSPQPLQHQQRQQSLLHLQQQQLQQQQQQHQQQQRLQEQQRALGQPTLTQQDQSPLGGNIPNNLGGALTSNNNPTGTNFNSAPAAYSSRQQKSHTQQDFADLVSRSQSTRYPQASPLQTQEQFAPASSSADDLPQTISSPLLPHGQPGQPIGPNYQQQHQAAPTDTKPSTRKLIKKILQGTSVSRAVADHHHHQQQPSYDNTAGLARRPSKRVSNPYPPSVRTGGSSLEQQQQQQQQQQQPPPLSDWSQTTQQAQQTPQSPLQDVGEVDESYIRERSNPELRVQTPQDPRTQPHQSTIRPVPADVETSPYSPDDIAFRQQQARQAQLRTQAQNEQHQQQYGQVVVDPAQEQYQYGRPQAQGQYPPANPPPLYIGHLTSQQTNPETVSQLSHESPVTDTDQHSTQLQSAQASPAVKYSQQDLASHPTQQPVSPLPSAAQPANMPPPPGPSGSIRRSGENDNGMRGPPGGAEPPPGPPPSYRHSQAPQLNKNLNPLPPTPGNAGNNRDFRASNVPERQAQQFAEGAGPEGGRHSPQPSTGERDSEPDKQFKDLLTKYKNVKRLYFDGKTQIEQLSTQVEHLQNAVANQRISQSRTALDDSEYTTRFNRLNGAINNLSFNIRKDWKSLPSWIERYVSADALKTGKQEMTAVGRAVIIKWVVDEVFNKCFHPGLEIEISQSLKEIEQNIRRFSYTLTSQEEYDALTSKVVSWRMTTLEGLQRALQSPSSADNRGAFTTLAAGNLTAHLYSHLVEPPPAGVDGSVAMIVELAVGIAANLCLESRDVAMSLPLPGDALQPDLMDVEKAGWPPLTEAEDAEDSGKDGDKSSKREKTKSGMLTMLGGAPHPGSRKSSIVSNTDATDPTAPAPIKDPNKIRFAGFVVVEVRGRQVLVKAPVWSLG